MSSAQINSYDLYPNRKLTGDVRGGIALFRGDTTNPTQLSKWFEPHQPHSEIHRGEYVTYRVYENSTETLRIDGPETTLRFTLAHTADVNTSFTRAQSSWTAPATIITGLTSHCRGDMPSQSGESVCYEKVHERGDGSCVYRVLRDRLQGIRVGSVWGTGELQARQGNWIASPETPGLPRRYCSSLLVDG